VVKVSFAELKERIQRHNELVPRWTLELGRKREEMVVGALLELEDEQLIKFFVKTTNLDRSDIIEGVDFYVIYTADRYKVCRLSVTGKDWVEAQKKQHPANQVISVDLDEEISSIKNEIIWALAAQERGWTS